MKICNKCNTKYDDDKNYCNFCEIDLPHSSEEQSAIAKKQDRHEKNVRQLRDKTVKLTTLDKIFGYQIIDDFGLVSGVSVNTANIIEGTTTYNLLKNASAIIDGKSKTDTKVLNRGKNEAMNDMIQKANEYNANAIIGIKYSISSSSRFSEIIVYGTAVIVKKS